MIYIYIYIYILQQGMTYEISRKHSLMWPENTSQDKISRNTQ